MADEISDRIICPYCGHLHGDMCDYPEDLSCGQDMKCLKCKKIFEASGEIKWVFYTYKKSAGS